MSVLLNPRTSLADACAMKRNTRSTSSGDIRLGAIPPIPNVPGTPTIRASRTAAARDGTDAHDAVGQDLYRR